MLSATLASRIETRHSATISQKSAIVRTAKNPHRGLKPSTISTMLGFRHGVRTAKNPHRRVALNISENPLFLPAKRLVFLCTISDCVCFFILASPSGFLYAKHSVFGHSKASRLACASSFALWLPRPHTHYGYFRLCSCQSRHHFEINDGVNQ